ncbi:MAG TPA: hypothetical protein VKS21_06150, partial [Spirochaetota bacterium]|nr:hypothetical protein [Spirochaetota bacterium]
ALTKYKQYMKNIITVLKKLNSNVILMTPSIYDQTAKIAEKTFYCNPALQKAATIIKKLAVIFFKSNFTKKKKLLKMIKDGQQTLQHLQKKIPAFKISLKPL